MPLQYALCDLTANTRSLVRVTRSVPFRAGSSWPVVSLLLCVLTRGAFDGRRCSVPLDSFIISLRALLFIVANVAQLFPRAGRLPASKKQARSVSRADVVKGG